LRDENTFDDLLVHAASSTLARCASSKNGRKYTAFGVAIISDRNLQAFHYNVVAFGKQGHFAKPLQTGTRIKLVVQSPHFRVGFRTLPRALHSHHYEPSPVT